jgi:DNA-binding response OmpR family regulator
MHQTCLIAAHDPWFIQLFRVYTEETGLRVIQVFEGQDIIPMIHKESPVVILLQMDLPGQIKSLEVLASLKKDPSACHIPVLVFSWQGTIEGLEEGTATHLQEPVTYEAFVDALKKVGIHCAAGVNDQPGPKSAIRKRKIQTGRGL